MNMKYIKKKSLFCHSTIKKIIIWLVYTVAYSSTIVTGAEHKSDIKLMGELWESILSSE